MSEFNGDYTGAGFTLGIDWAALGMTAQQTDGEVGSYIGFSDKFNNRRLVGSNGSAVMAGVVPAAGNNLVFSTPHDESTIRAGFNHPELFTMSPDIWFMNGNQTDVNYNNGVQWTPSQRMSATLANTVAGNYQGRAEDLEGFRFRGSNGAEITMGIIVNPDIINFTTNNTEAEVRAGFEFPNMWEYIVPVTGGAGDCLPDCKYNALIALGFTGHVNDMELAYLQSLGAISDQINDAWLEVAGAGQYNDQVMAYMIAQGAVGEQFNDVELSYWCDVVTPPPVGAFSDGFSTGFEV